MASGPTTRPGGRRSRSVLVRDEGPCGNTTVTEGEVESARRLFLRELPTATSGLSIVQRLAVSSASNATDPGVESFFATRRPAPVPLNAIDGGFSSSGSNSGGSGGDDEDGPTGVSRPTMSQRVVNSHLDYFRKFTPFREGRFTKDTLYEFLFFAVVENRMRMSYARRVLRNLLSYVRRYLAEKGGGDRVVVLIEKAHASRSVRLDIVLTRESVEFFRDNPRGTVVQSKLFYRLMNAVGERTNNQRLKNVVCEARRPRDLVFSEQQNATLLAFALKALRVIADKYLRRWRCPSESGNTAVAKDSHSRDVVIDRALNSLVSPASAANTTRRESDVERTTFEFSVAFLLGFLTGARTKSTVARLTVGEVDRLVRGGTIEKLTKGSFARVFVPAGLAYSETKSPYEDGDAQPWSSFTGDGGVLSFSGKRERESVARSLYETTLVRRDPLLYPVRLVCRHVGAGGRCGYGPYRQCRNERSVREGDTSDARDRPSTVYRAKTGRVTVGCPYGSVECERSGSGTGGSGDLVEDQTFFLSGGRQLDYTFDRIYADLFGQRRPKGVLWHSQRRRYLGTVNDKFGAVTASKSVGHADVETTMSYINKSVHHEDTNRRAGSAVYEEMMRLMDGERPSARTRVPVDTGDGGGDRPVPRLVF